MNSKYSLGFVLLVVFQIIVFHPMNCSAQDPSAIKNLAVPKTDKSAIRFATFNSSLFRPQAGDLLKELESGSDHIKVVVAIIQAVQPDVLLLNEFDYDGGDSAKELLADYLNKDNSNPWKFSFTGPVNTGVDSGLDLDGDGKLQTGNDAWGFGRHPGQYGMLVISRYPIAESSIRTFQDFKWHLMPDALKPLKPDGKPFYADEIWQQLRLSSKSHWDVPIQISSKQIHFVVAHPTPPVFDGPEDRNGRRNHDEIRLLRDYVCPEFKGDYIVDDKGRSGDLSAGSLFVVAGDLNSDPNDGDGIHDGIKSLLESPSVNQSTVPHSEGAPEAAKIQGEKNALHKGDAKQDTTDFNDKSVGNIRCDYVIPSKDLKIIDSGVFWPKRDQLPPDVLDISDHRLVWVDLSVPQ